MNIFYRSLLLLTLSHIPFAAPAQAQPAEEKVLELVATIALPGVKGRIDHLAIDAKRNRLFVAALGNGSLEVIELNANRRQKSLPGFVEPQGVEYVPGPDRLYIATGEANRVDILDGTSLVQVKRVELKDADNIRYDFRSETVYVGYGAGALRAMDVRSGESVADFRLAGHPESFQLEQSGSRIFVNVPSARHIAVVDKVKRSVVATWEVSAAESNFPMALDEAGHRLFVGARKPAVMLIYDTDTGKLEAKHPIGGDTDDIFFDPDHKRVYVICGEGRIDVFGQESSNRYTYEGSVKTAPRARTGLFVPEKGKLYVAAPAVGTSPARVLVYRVR